MPKLTLRGVTTDDELAMANDLMGRVHFQEYSPGARWLRESGAGYPGFRREHTRIAILQGQLAGALRLTTDTIRIGEARLRMGGLGCVTTAGPYRHQGVARELILDTLRYMRAHKYHVSMLFGIPNFYHRFGFATSLSEYATVISVREALDVEHLPCKPRDFKPGDIRAVQKIHEDNDAHIPCSLVRGAAHIANQWHRWKETQVLMDEKGRVLAYYVPALLEDELQILDLGTHNYRFCGSLLHACARKAREQSCARIRFLAPPSHPLMQYLLRFRSVQETRIPRNEGGMMAFADLGETLESMIPEWELHLQNSELREQDVEVTLLIDRNPIRLRAHRGALGIAAVSGANKVSLTTLDLVHLVTGFRYVEEILAAERRILTPSARALLETIFPKRHPYVWHNDRF